MAARSKDETGLGDEDVMVIMKVEGGMPGWTHFYQRKGGSFVWNGFFCVLGKYRGVPTNL